MLGFDDIKNIIELDTQDYVSSVNISYITQYISIGALQKYKQHIMTDSKHYIIDYNGSFEIITADGEIFEIDPSRGILIDEQITYHYTKNIQVPYILTDNGWFDKDGNIIMHSDTSMYRSHKGASSIFTGSCNEMKKSFDFLTRCAFNLPLVAFTSLEITNSEMDQLKDLFTLKKQVFVQIWGDGHVISLFVYKDNADNCHGTTMDFLNGDSYVIKFLDEENISLHNVAKQIYHKLSNTKDDPQRHKKLFDNGLKCMSISMAFYMALARNDGDYDEGMVQTELNNMINHNSLLDWRKDLFYFLLNGDFKGNTDPNKMRNLFALLSITESISTVDTSIVRSLELK